MKTRTMTIMVICILILELLPSPACAQSAFSIPAYLVDSTRVGELILGKTTLQDATRMFPEASDQYEGSPRAPQGFPPVKIGEKAPLPVVVYNPPETMYALFFDEHDKLVIVQDLASPLQGLERDQLAQAVPSFRELKETDRGEGYYEMQGGMLENPCIAILLVFDDSSDRVSQSAYAFCCETE